MEKIKMTTPLVEMDGDEMTRVIWQMIKDELICPFVDLKSEYYDLGLEYRNKTNDQVTVDSAEATKKYGVAVKCATITPNAARMTEYNLKEMWKSPNGTIRAILDGTVFRAPILVKGVEPYVKNWVKPITIARHAYGDVYKGAEMKIPGPGKVELVYTAADGTETRELVHDFKSAGIVQGMHNLTPSIESFARSDNLRLRCEFVLKRCFHIGNELIRINNTGNLDGSSEHRSIREILTQNFLGNAACINGAYPAWILAQLLTDFCRSLGGVDDDSAIRLETLEHIYGFNQAFIDHNHIIRIINIGMNRAAGITDAVICRNRRTHTFRTIFRKTLYILAGAEGCISQQEASCLGTLTTAAMPADFNDIFHEKFLHTIVSTKKCIP